MSNANQRAKNADELLQILNATDADKTVATPIVQSTSKSSEATTIPAPLLPTIEPTTVVVGGREEEGREEDYSTMWSVVVYTIVGLTTLVFGIYIYSTIPV